MGLNKQIIKPEEVTGKTYTSVDEMLKDLGTHKGWNIFDYLESYWHRYFWNYVSDIPLRVKTFIQRGIKGWANQDTWEFDYYLAKIISEGVEHLRDNSNSAYDKKTLTAMKEIIKTFETAKDILECKRMYIPSKEFTWKAYKKGKRFSKKLHKEHPDWCEHYPLTLREAKRFEKGFDYFKEHFFHLGD